MTTMTTYAPDVAAAPDVDSVVEAGSIQCPSCASRFKTPVAVEKLVGKLVKCSRCGHKWRYELETAQSEHASADAEAAVAGYDPDQEGGGREAPDLAVQLEQMEAGVARQAEAEAVAQRARKKRQRLWLLALILFLLLDVALLVFRPKIVKIWPASDRVYQLFGLAVPSLGEGLAIRELVIDFVPGGESLVPLALSGSIVNQSKHPLAIPNLTATLRNADRQPLTTWTITVDAPMLKPAESYGFKTKLPMAIPKEATQLMVTFTAGVLSADAPQSKAEPVKKSEDEKGGAVEGEHPAADGGHGGGGNEKADEPHADAPAPAHH